MFNSVIYVRKKDSRRKVNRWKLKCSTGESRRTLEHFGGRLPAFHFERKSRTSLLNSSGFSKFGI